MTTITLSPGVSSTESHASTFEIETVNNVSTPRSGRRCPVFIPKDQAYYWSSAWQLDEDAALREITAGNVRRFDSGATAAAWLLSDED